MQIKLLLLLTLISTYTLASVQVPPVIYGEDNRIDVEYSRVALYRKLARSTAAMIANSNIREFNSIQVMLNGPVKMKDRNYCETERFYSQPMASHCSGFLVAKNIIVTAGHCFDDERPENFSWVFDYKVDHELQAEVIADSSKVYKIKRVLYQLVKENKNPDSLDVQDYAVIELERDVEDRNFLEYRKSGKPKVGDELVVIGNPWGLPTKITDGGKVRSLEKHVFLTDLDTYQGNSGSAVFNTTSGIVEGILVNGEYDFSRSDEGCTISNVIAQNAGSGEGVTYITTVPGL